LKAAGIPNPRWAVKHDRNPVFVGDRSDGRSGVFRLFSPELEWFTGVGHSVEDCLYKARWGMQEHVEVMAERKLPIPPRNPNPMITIRNEGQAAVA
jgi:predicted RNase H-like HicB family nuclease